MALLANKLTHNVFLNLKVQLTAIASPLIAHANRVLAIIRVVSLLTY